MQDPKYDPKLAVGAIRTVFAQTPILCELPDSSKRKIASNVLEEAYKSFLTIDHDFVSLPDIRDGIHYGFQQTPLFAVMNKEHLLTLANHVAFQIEKDAEGNNEG